MNDNKAINQMIQDNKSKGISSKDITDGYHTFDELYFNRMVLFAVICNENKLDSFKSMKHDDGTMFEDSFIVGINTQEGWFTYHYHVEYWDMFDVPEWESGPKWDGHTASDVTRLLKLNKRR